MGFKCSKQETNIKHCFKGKPCTIRNNKMGLSCAKLRAILDLLCIDQNCEKYDIVYYDFNFGAGFFVTLKGPFWQVWFGSIWYVWFGLLDLVMQVWFGRFGLVHLVLEVWFGMKMK